MPEASPTRASLPAAPPPELRFRRRISLVGSARALWRSRELVRTLVERDLRARYRQAILGLAWAVIPPVALLLVFSVFVRRVGSVYTEGVDYELYAYMGLIPWQFFSASVSVGGQSLLNNLALLNKVYCPREVFPLASVVVAAFDTLMATTVLGVLFVITGAGPTATAVWAPLLVLIALAFTTGLTLLISSVVIYVRDLRHALPLVVQFGLFATPVAYSLDAIPRGARPWYAVVNPLGPAIDGLRKTVLLGEAPPEGLTAIAAVSSIVVLLAGFYAFKRLETGIADVG